MPFLSPVLRSEDKSETLQQVNSSSIVQEVEKLSEPETTYNFEVEDFHTYYVTRSIILTHNQCLQKHHYLTNKNDEFTPRIKKITDKYNLDLEGSWNKELLPHCGRHAKEYHKYMHI